AARTMSWKRAVKLVVESIPVRSVRSVPHARRHGPTIVVTNGRRIKRYRIEGGAGLCYKPPFTRTSSHAAPRHDRRRQRLPRRPPRREPALAGPRGGGRARLHVLRVRRDPPAGGGADRALRALARRDHRHRREGDVLVRGPRRDRAHAASRGDRGRGRALPGDRPPPAEPNPPPLLRRPEVPPWPPAAR